MFLVRLNFHLHHTKRVAHDYSSYARAPLVLNFINYIDSKNSHTTLKLKKSNKQEDAAAYYKVRLL